VTTNEADRTDDRRPATEVVVPDESVDEPEADGIEERDESRLAAEPEPSTSAEHDTEPAGVAEDDAVVAGDRSDDDTVVAADRSDTGTVEAGDRSDDDTVVAGDRSDTGASSGAAGDVASGVDGPLLADATRYQDRWYEIQTGFVDEPSNAVQSAGELLTEMMDDLTRRLTTELGAFDAGPGAGADISTEDLRVTFQRYRGFFDRLLAA
jgi:hypothetical protein